MDYNKRGNWSDIAVVVRATGGLSAMARPKTRVFLAVCHGARIGALGLYLCAVSMALFYLQMMAEGQPDMIGYWLARALVQMACAVLFAWAMINLTEVIELEGR